LDETTRVLSTRTGSASQVRVVIVGGVSATFCQLTAVLASPSRRVATVASGQEARDTLAGEADPAVVVVDLRAPGMDALEVLQAVRADEGSRMTPVLLLVDDVHGGEKWLTELSDLGAVDVVAAPVDDEVLCAKVALLADLADKTRQLAVLTDRLHDADERSEQHRKALVAQQSVMLALADGGSGDVLSIVAQSLARGLGWQVGVCWRVTDEQIWCSESWLEPSFSAPTLERLHSESRPGNPGNPGGLVQRAASSGVPEWAPMSELDHDDPYVRAALDAGLSHGLALPIAVDSTLVGVIELLRTSRRPPDLQTVTTLGAVAALVAHFARARRTEDETEMLKNEFFALVSHEMLTPLTSILGYLEDLLEGASGEFNADQEQDLGVIDRNARRLFRLVDDLVFVAQAEGGGTVSLNLASVDLSAVVAEAVDAAQTAAEAHDIGIVARVEPVGTVRGDVRRLGQVVDHLLSNAVKFSHDGGRVEVVLRRQDGDAVIEVVDEGFGIPLAEQAAMYERFSRSSIASDREIPGIGLGLSITKMIAEAHGGSIAMRSVEASGSTFTLALPLEARAISEGSP
jgi:signal transduction histidine kinase/DNA-binding NarL/FixJ family response regulator